MTTPENLRLRLSIDDEGSVVLGSPAPPGPLTAWTFIDGGVMTVDMLDPTGTPAVVLGDVLAGRRWLDETLGAQVGRQVQEATGGGQSTQVVTTPSAEWTYAAQLAVARWVRRWHPGTRNAPLLDLDLLDLQIGHLTFLADPVVGDDAPDIGAALIEPHLNRLARELQSGLDGPPDTAAEDRVQRILQEVLDTALRLTGLDDDTHARLSDLADALEVREVVERDFAEQATKAVSTSPTGVYAAEVGSLDWEQLPPRVFRTEEGTVTWEVGEGTVTVEITGVLDPAAVRGLRVRLYTPGRLVPVAVGDLSVDGSGDRALAYADLTLPASVPRQGLVVDVYDPALSRPVRLGTAARYAAQERQAVRVVAGLRSGSLNSEAAVQTIDRTIDRLRGLPEWSGTGRDEDLARRLRRLGDHVAVDATPPWPPTAAELRLR